MPLVYLDTSHLSLLADARRNDPAGYAAFCALWRSRGCSLALSLVHTRELRRYGTRRKRRARFGVFVDLLPLRTDACIFPGTFPAFQPLIKRELLAALLARRVLRTDLPLPADVQFGLPQVLNTSQEVHALRSTSESWLIGLVLRLMHDAERTGAEATQLSARASRLNPGSTKRHTPRLAQLGDVRPTPEQRAMVLDNLEENVRRSSWLWRLLWIVAPRRIRQRALAQVREPMERFFDRAESEGAERAYADFVGAPDTEKARRRSIDDLTAEHLVRSTAIDLLTVDLGFDRPSEARAIAASLVLGDAPGAWLAEHTRRRLLDSKATFTGNDERDLDHLAYAPWVDVFFADGGTAEFARQALRGPALPDRLQQMPLPIRVPGSLTALRQALDTATVKRSI